jgi:hypothetical protein
VLRFGQHVSRLSHLPLEIVIQLAKLRKAVPGFLREDGCDGIDACVHADQG